MFASLWAIAIELLWKSTAVLSLACVAALLLQKGAAAARHWIWILALGCLLLLPVLQTALPAWRIAAPQRNHVAMSESWAVPRGNGTAVMSRPVRIDWSETAGMAILATWIAGIIVCLWRWRNGARQVTLLCRRATPLGDVPVLDLAREAAAQLGLEHEVKLLRSDRDITPMATGLRVPVVLLPASSANWPGERLRMVLLHEMAHIRRRDCLVQALAELVRSLYWFHPLVWFAMRRLRMERERASDDLVLCAGNRASDYAAHLLALARPARAREYSAAAISMASSHLEARVRAILNPRLNRRACTLRTRLTAALVAASVVMPLAAMRPQAGDARTVSGTVYDAEGARVPAAQVIVTNNDTGEKRAASTDEVGQFSIGPLPDGVYRLEVDARGFAPAVRALKIEGRHARHFDITVDLAGAEEAVVVRGKGSAAAPGGPLRIRVGGNVVPAKLISSVDPEYPEGPRSRGTEGDVVLRAVVLMDGSVGGLTVVATPDPELARAAMAAVRQWRYQPSLLNGKPVETVTTITVNFELEP